MENSGASKDTDSYRLPRVPQAGKGVFTAAQLGWIP